MAALIYRELFNGFFHQPDIRAVTEREDQRSDTPFYSHTNPYTLNTKGKCNREKVTKTYPNSPHSDKRNNGTKDGISCGTQNTGHDIGK